MNKEGKNEGRKGGKIKYYSIMYLCISYCIFIIVSVTVNPKRVVCACLQACVYSHMWFGVNGRRKQINSNSQRQKSHE